MATSTTLRLWSHSPALRSASGLGEAVPADGQAATGLLERPMSCSTTPRFWSHAAASSWWPTARKMPRASWRYSTASSRFPASWRAKPRLWSHAATPRRSRSSEEGLAGVHEQPDGHLELTDLGQQHGPVVVEAGQHRLVAGPSNTALARSSAPRASTGRPAAAERLGQHAVARGDHLGLGAVLEEVVPQPVEPVDRLVGPPEPEQGGRGHPHGPVGGGAVALRVELAAARGHDLGLGQAVVEGEGLGQMHQRGGPVGAGRRVGPPAGPRHLGALGALGDVGALGAVGTLGAPAGLAAPVGVAHRSRRVTVPIPGRPRRPAGP